MKNPIIFYIFGTPYPCNIQTAALTGYYICLLMDLFTVTDLLRQVGNQTVMKLQILMIIGTVSLGLKPGLIS